QDRWFVLGAANERQWALLCEVLERPDLKDDPRFATNSDRLQHRQELEDELNQVFAARPADYWLEQLGAGGLPCGPINSVPDVFSHPQAEDRAFALEVEHPTAGKVKVPGFPYKLSATPAGVHRPPPRLGEHTAEVLEQVLGLTSDDVARLRSAGAI
ncbi:MAG: CoA transferase, partial [Anaerolineae bacterium]